MRVYVPSTVNLLRAAVGSGVIEPLGGVVFAVTDELRSEYAHTDDEELEYLAMSDAARASLRLLARELAAGTSLRVVIAADVPALQPAAELDRAAARVTAPVRWSEVAAVHIDGADAAPAVQAAVEVVDAADLGDENAEYVVGDVQDVDLAWYAPDEVRFLLHDLDGSG